MYIIIVYDINVERLSKMYKLCKIYLHHIQNSVFEGEITQKDFNEFKEKAENIINAEEDSLIIFKLRSNSLIDRQVIGVEKGTTSNIIFSDEENIKRHKCGW